ncbi:hypothetical protein N658DRAFT_274784 [Parathielavia hyrcaniae]|uniref:Secreted protein n=1 Tax=Parathielavia hyrcaniae TaxID=113614 RepID=A0AAN6Q810_9PEZI|nr:hypothetical protein N658DRAFT_274784 [Parathielavia hyrcaniae]
MSRDRMLAGLGQWLLSAAATALRSLVPSQAPVLRLHDHSTRQTMVRRPEIDTRFMFTTAGYCFWGDSAPNKRDHGRLCFTGSKVCWIREYILLLFSPV